MFGLKYSAIQNLKLSDITLIQKYMTAVEIISYLE